MVYICLCKKHINFIYDSTESERKDEINMKETFYDHRTGETVMVLGSYLSQSGKIIVLKAGERFPHCPDSGKETNWGHAVGGSSSRVPKFAV
jgi:hypothetical protein